MLRLWPRPLVRANLFPAGGWVSGGGATTEGGAPAAQLGQLLCERRDVRIAVALSDVLAAMLEIPWSEQLRKRGEQVAYARALFERAGLDVPLASAISVLYRRIGQPGLAYALDHALLDSLQEVAAAGRNSLVNVMPLSAIAYWRGTKSNSQQLLVEEGRLTLLRRHGMALLEVEPVADGIPTALRRLLARAPLDEDAPLHLWSAAESSDAIVKAVEAGAHRNPLRLQARDHWSALQ